MIRFETNLSGTAYRRLIQYAASRAPYFALADRESLQRNERCMSILKRLEPFLVNVHVPHELQGRNEIAYTDGYIYVYKCCEETTAILTETADCLYAWQHPDLPEDLCFWNSDGSDFLVTIAHEKIGYILDGGENSRNSDAFCRSW